MSGTIAPPMLSCRAKGQRDSLSACDPDCFLMPRMRRARSVHLPHVAWGGIRFTSVCNYSHKL
jgi:hypothetical protein